MTVIAAHFKRSLFGLLIVSAVWCTPAQASTLWYNGNLDNRDAFVNQTTSLAPGGLDGRIYDDFVVPAGHTWTLTGVFSNDIQNPLFTISTPTTASWQILSGVSAGNGGTVVASGDGTDTVTASGRTSSVLYSPFTATEYTNQVNGLSVTLSAGTYWLSVAPDTNGSFDSAFYITTTSGAGAIGTPPGNDGNSYFTSSFTGDYFTSASSLEGPGTWDYSMGVVGTSAVTPEPSTITLVLGAGLSLAVCVFGRRKIAAVSQQS